MLGLCAAIYYGINNETLQVSSTTSCVILKNINGNYVQLNEISNGTYELTIYNQLFIKEKGTETAEPNYFLNKVVNCDENQRDVDSSTYFGGAVCKNIAFIITLTLLPPPKSSTYIENPQFTQLSC